MSLVLASVDQGVSLQAGIVCEDYLKTPLLANVNNWAPPGYDQANYWEILPNNNFNVTGIKGGVRGRVLYLGNIDPLAARIVTLVGESALSDPANRINLNAFGPTLAILSSAICVLIYSPIYQRWVLVSST